MIKGLRQITPYVPGAQPKGEDLIKLNTNENPYPPSPKVKEALDGFSYEKLRKYSTVDQPELRQALADQHGLDKDQIIIGSGSDEVLAMAFLAFFNNEAPLLFPKITYGFYKVLSELYHVPYKEVPLTSSFEIQTSDYFEENGGVIWVNPNAPTGLLKPLSEIEELLKANPEVVVVIDEAYINFAEGKPSAIALLDKYPNLFVVRTFSKDASLAGLRVGYGMGSKELIAIMNAIKDSVNPYNLDMIAEQLALAAVEDWAYYEGTMRDICQSRDQFADQLKELGFEVLDSHTNFLLTKPIKHPADQWLSYLESQKIYVRHFPAVEEIKDYLRISIGTPEEMAKLLSAIKANL